MKPRLESAPPTEEDIRIWRVVCVWYWHKRHGFCAEHAARSADRCDADLMYHSEFRKSRPECYGTLSVAGMVSTEIELGFAEAYL